MVDYIVDASIVIQRLIQQPFTHNAQMLFNQITANDRLIVPEFCIIECTNVIWKQVRFFGMPQPQAGQLVKDLLALPLKRAPVKKLLDNALKIGLKYQLAVYDSVYYCVGTPTQRFAHYCRSAPRACGGNRRHCVKTSNGL